MIFRFWKVFKLKKNSNNFNIQNQHQVHILMQIITAQYKVINIIGNVFIPLQWAHYFWSE